MSKVQTRKSLSVRGETYAALLAWGCARDVSVSQIVEEKVAEIVTFYRAVKPDITPLRYGATNPAISGEARKQAHAVNRAIAHGSPVPKAVAILDDVITLPRRYPMHELNPGALPVRVYKHVPRFDSETPGPPPQTGGDRSPEEKAASLAKIKEAARKMGKGRIGGGF